MKKLLILICLLFLNGCTTAKYQQEPIDTFLGIKVGVMPDLPKCGPNAAKNNSPRCISIISDGEAEVHIPKQENTTGIPINSIYIDNTGDSSAIILDIPFAHSKEALSYLTFRYGDYSNSLTEENGTQRYIFLQKNGNFTEFWQRENKNGAQSDVIVFFQPR